MRKLLLFWLLGVTATACGTTTVSDVIDCTTTQIVAEIGQFEPVVKALIQEYTAPDGTINWTPVGALLVNLAVNDGMCVVADIVAASDAPIVATDAAVSSDASVASDAGVAAPAVSLPKVSALHDGFAKLRAQHNTTKSYKTRYGVI